MGGTLPTKRSLSSVTFIELFGQNHRTETAILLTFHDLFAKLGIGFVDVFCNSISGIKIICLGFARRP